ncbi:hypothetical protein AB4865_11615 [Capnocytophaga sp. ARDL2]|uniref:hypothetical protein n=1 Tax=Capnocytophaga sp. ARDL2 TaxID=3238809 RepID=UPI0035576C17
MQYAKDITTHAVVEENGIGKPVKKVDNYFDAGMSFTIGWEIVNSVGFVLDFI